MGIYFNPSNDSFTKDKNSELYLDKTGLLEYLNRVICTNANCISVSHARRFGKSHAAFDLALQNFIFDKRQKYCIIYIEIICFAVCRACKKLMTTFQLLYTI